ncbi:alpha-L-arabinofuranosidase [Bradyrhizobium sp. LB12.1]
MLLCQKSSGSIVLDVGRGLDREVCAPVGGLKALPVTLGSARCLGKYLGRSTATFPSMATSLMTSWLKPIWSVDISMKSSPSQTGSLRRRSSKRIMLSFDEWNVWYRTRDRATRTKPGWPEAPAILEELYTMEDTLVFGAALLTLINRCDRVKAACVAQLVNVTGLIMTETGGRAWRQPIFYPFQHASQWARGTVLDMRLICGTFAASNGERFPDIVSTAVLAEDGQSLALFCVNRNFGRAIDLNIDLRGFKLDSFIDSRVMTSADLDATNTADDPERVRPERGPDATIDNGVWQLKIPPASWSVFRFACQ